MHHPQTHAMQQPVHQQSSPVEFAVETPTAGEAVLSLAEARLFERAAAGERGAIAEVWRSNRRWIAAVLVSPLPMALAVGTALFWWGRTHSPRRHPRHGA